MKPPIKRKLLQVALTLSLLYAIKLKEPKVTYLDLVKVAPAAYSVVEKATSLKQSSKKERSE